MLQINRILVPIDWAELSNRAFQLAASLARDHSARSLTQPSPNLVSGSYRVLPARTRPGETA